MYDCSRVLRILRVENHLSQQEMAEKLHVSRASYSLWESGKRSPKKENCELICKLFNCDMNYLLGFTTIRKSESTGIDVPLFREDTPEQNIIRLPEYLLEPGKTYWAETRDDKSSIFIYERQSKQATMIITKI